LSEVRCAAFRRAPERHQQMLGAGLRLGVLFAEGDGGPIPALAGATLEQFYPWSVLQLRGC